VDEQTSKCKQPESASNDESTRRTQQCKSVQSRWSPDYNNAIGYAKFRSRSHDAAIRVNDEAGNVIETHEHAGITSA
jgi:hypothetical protein